MSELLGLGFGGVLIFLVAKLIIAYSSNPKRMRDKHGEGY